MANDSSKPSSPPILSRPSTRSGFFREPDLYTSLLSRLPGQSNNNDDDAPSTDHGTFPRNSNAESRPSSLRAPTPNRMLSFGAIPILHVDGLDSGDGASIRSLERDANSNSRLKNVRASTSQLMIQGGVKHPWLKYLSYYIPILNWLWRYELKSLAGDVVAGITMATIYIPMALSLASNLAHVPPVQGLYAFAISPIIYASLGSCPQMVVGPEAAGSLLVGEAVRSYIRKGKTHDDDDVKNAIMAGIVTSMSGCIILAAGVVRLGFLDSVLSRALLRGFISAVGFVITIDQLLPELGLQHFARDAGVSHESTFVKIEFILKNLRNMHVLTSVVSIISVVIIMGFKKIKARLQKRHHWVVYIPDRFLVVVVSAILAGTLHWEDSGLELLGEVSSGQFGLHFPYKKENIPKMRDALSTAFLIAVLGFFESVVAAKSLGNNMDANVSSNRELVALGIANVTAGLGCALPAFGGYGRSKLNASTGGTTPMSSLVLSGITIISIIWLLPTFYYIPRAVLSAMITSVAFSLLEEAPADIRFFIRIRSYPDLFMMLLVFTLTILYSLELGIAVGVGLSLVQILKHATRARISILGRVPHSVPITFKSAEDFPEEIVQVEGCLIVKIPEPLTFANAGDLKNRLRRLEVYGSIGTHPSLPRLRSREHNRNIIFDVHGLTGMDGSGTQVFKEIVVAYRERGVRVFFSRGPKVGGHVWELFERSGIVEIVGGQGRFLENVEAALREMENEEAIEAGGGVV